MSERSADNIHNINLVLTDPKAALAQYYSIGTVHKEIKSLYVLRGGGGGHQEKKF